MSNFCIPPTTKTFLQIIFKNLHEKPLYKLNFPETSNEIDNKKIYQHITPELTINKQRQINENIKDFQTVQ